MQLPVSQLEGLLTQRLLRGLVRRVNNLKIAGMARQVANLVPKAQGQPVAFFKASTGIDDLSWNSGFHLLTSWGLRLQGVPVVYFGCSAGMSHCVLGTDRERVHRAPPCKSCTYQSRTLYTGVPSYSNAESAVHWFTFDRDADLEAALSDLTLADLIGVTWPVSVTASEGRSRANLAAKQSAGGPALPLPLGELCLPGLRWILRRHNLEDDENTRYLLREYILSAWNVAQKFAYFLSETNPRAVVVFNGQFFPEATAALVARRRGLRVITHEVGLRPASAFFSDGEATAYPIYVPDDFELTLEQSARLDSYLEGRFKGHFSMAGIRFWPSMRGLDGAFLEKAARFEQIIAVFTNVIFDTSQPHANTVFADMFAWLNMVLEAIRAHPETLFVIRAHPDETRTRKESRETVRAWVQEHGVDKLDNVVFVAPTESLSSYELIQRSKFVVVYNSTIGLEAAIMGKPVLCGGRARFTQYPTVFFPQTVEEQRAKLEQLLAAHTIETPPDFKRNARRFLYYQLYRASLPFDRFLMSSVRVTQSRLRSFGTQELLSSEAIRTISRGLLQGGSLLLDE